MDEAAATFSFVNAPLIGRPGSRARLVTPALILNLDAFERNLERMARLARAAGCGLRPHAKAHKSGEVARAQVAAGAIGASCATMQEAEVMGAAGVPSVLVTSPVVGPPAIDRLLRLHGDTGELIVVVDHADNARAIDAAAQGATVSVLIDVNVGQNRTGVAGEAEVLALAQVIRDCTHLRLRGIQAYYGTLQHLPAYADRKAATTEPRVAIRGIVAALKAAGHETGIVSGGGTGTHHIDMADGVFTELQVGSYAFLDSQYDGVALHPDDPHPFEDSLFVQGTVVSDNQPGIVVVDCGWKAFATEGKAPQPLDGRTGFRFMGDEHCGLPREAEGLATLALGDTVIFRPPHCDPTVNLFSAFQCVRDDTLEAIWPIEARGY